MIDIPTEPDGQRDEAKVFLSYSRRDRERASGIAEALRARHYGVFKDTDDILPTEEWRIRLEELIAEADTVVFLLSPHSATSEVCAWEVEYASSLNKRIAPIVIEDVEPERIPAQLARLNFIFCTPRDPFENAVDTLASALSTDIDWIREHTRLAALARRWRGADQATRLLLRGQDIGDAEAWRDGHPKGAPEVTPDQAAFVAESRRAAGRRQRTWITGSLAVAGLAAALAVFAYVQSVEADQQRAEAESQRELAEISAQSEALARFHAESRLADAISPRGDGEAWRLITGAAQGYATAVGQDTAFAALDGDMLRIALGALLKQRTLDLGLPRDPGARVLGFLDGGQRILIHGDEAISVIDAETGNHLARLGDLGIPLYVRPGGGDKFAVVACREAPCLSTPPFSSVGERYVRGDEAAAAFINDYAAALFGGGGAPSDEQMDQIWEALDSPKASAMTDLSLGKLSMTFVGSDGQEPTSARIFPCGADVCVGEPNAVAAGALEPGFLPDEIGDLTTRHLTLAPAMVTDTVFAKSAPIAAPIGFHDPEAGPVIEFAPSPDLVVRTSYLSAEIEIFRRDRDGDLDGSWQRRTLCLEWDVEYDECAGGLVGVQPLAASEAAGRLLVTSINQGTGGGAGAHHTSLIDIDAGVVVWRVDRVSSRGSFSPDGNVFALVDWLGELEVRDLDDHNLIYRHVNRVRESDDSFVFAPRGDLGAIVEEDGRGLLVDLTASANLVMTSQPLRSQRSQCRDTNDGPFRALATSTRRPFTPYDWAWDTAASAASRLQVTVWNADAERAAPATVTHDQAGLTIAFTQGADDIFLVWSLLETPEAPVLARDFPINVSLSNDRTSLVLWGTPVADDDYGAAWFWLSSGKEGWTVVKAGRVSGFSDGPAPVTFQVNGQMLAFYDGDCRVRLTTSDDSWPDLVLTPAFGNQVELGIDREHGVLTVISYEWYGSVAVQVFDLTTGASGPWLNVPSDVLPETRPTSLRTPPWGDQLRRLLLANRGGITQE